MRRTIAALAVVAGMAAAQNAQSGWGGVTTPASGSSGGMQAPDGGTGQEQGMPEHTGPHPTLLSYAGTPVNRPPDKYGFLPAFKNIFRKKSACDDCNGASHGHKGGAGLYSGPAAGGNMGPAPQQGTLVYPNHPFVRGPRDFFMWGN